MQYHIKYKNTKTYETLRGSLTIIFCIFKQIGYHMSRAMKSGILQQLDCCFSTVHWHTVLLKRSFLCK